MDYSENMEKYTIPKYMKEGILRYLEKGIRPGDFLTAVICNDLRGALAHADDINIVLLPNYVRYFNWEAPSECWGSPEKMKKWILKRRAENESK